MSTVAAGFERARGIVPRPRGVWGFVLRRVLLGLLTLFLVSIVVFAATQTLPGDAARAFLGRNATPESLATLRKQLHLNEPVVSQYLHWLGGIFRGDLGNSLTGSQQPVTSVIEVLESDYVEMARLKGLREQTVLWRHALPNGIAPAIQVIALNLAYLAGGIVVVEFVFAYPGIGSAFVGAVHNRDLPTVQALGILIAAAYVFLNVAADVATILVSPRLRTSLK